MGGSWPVVEKKLSEGVYVVCKQSNWCSDTRDIIQWKNHFFEMKGDVGMSSHEKKGNPELLSIRRAMEP